MGYEQQSIVLCAHPATPRAAAPQEWSDSEQLLDGSHVAGASRGNIEGSGLGGLGGGTLLQASVLRYPELPPPPPTPVPPGLRR